MSVIRRPGPITSFVLDTRVAPSIGTEVSLPAATGDVITSISPVTNRVTAMLDSVSLSGTENVELLLGTATGVVTTGYDGQTMQNDSATTSDQNWSPDAILLGFNITSADDLSGHITMTHSGSNKWIISGIIENKTGSQTFVLAGVQPLPGVLDRVQIQAQTTDTFSGGTWNLMFN